jgi:hypothetical protein
VIGNNGLFYYLTDHLGSTSVLMTSSNGIKGGSSTRYHPFGSYRGTAPSQTITDRNYFDNVKFPEHAHFFALCVSVSCESVYDLSAFQ